MLKFTYSPEPALEPMPGCSWADTMVLNPAIIQDPDQKNVIHMLFRATGPWHQKNLKGLCDPYPIFLGYAKSEDMGKTWKADFSRPALAPAIEYEIEKIYIHDDEGNRVVNYANGCIEDPRIFEVEGQYYVSVACRMFPPGPYWLGDKRRDNLPDWAVSNDHPFGLAVSKNDTTTVLYKLDLKKLISGDYEQAFQYICPLTNPEVSDNRDVFLFPKKMKIQGKMQYVMLHRPAEPNRFECAKGVHKPSIFLASAERIKDFSTDKSYHKLAAVPEYDWEEERIGASWQPLDLGNGEWLISYHGKQWPGLGYSQSFMIMKEKDNDLPEIINRCSERLMYAQQKWELPDKFLCPCIFTTGGIVIDGTLIMSYGAADQKAGISWVNLKELTDYVRKFDAKGNKIKD